MCISFHKPFIRQHNNVRPVRLIRKEKKKEPKLYDEVIIKEIKDIIIPYHKNKFLLCKQN